MIEIQAPLFLVLPNNPLKKYFLSFNNYHTWPIHIRGKLRRAYCDLIKGKAEELHERFSCNIHCEVVVHPPNDGRIRDSDNHGFLHAKWTNDALTEVGCWVDDQRVVQVTLKMGEYCNDSPHATIRYTPAP